MLKSKKILRNNKDFHFKMLCINIYLNNSSIKLSENWVKDKQPPKSLVFWPLLSVLNIDFSSKIAFSFSPMCFKNKTPLKKNAIGLAISFPAISGALPWTASNIAISLPIFAAGATPRPPINPAIRSDKISP